MEYIVSFRASALVEANSPEEAIRKLDAEMPDYYSNGKHFVTFDHEYDAVPTNATGKEHLLKNAERMAEWSNITLIDVDAGEAYIRGYYEANENEYGPQPFRYVEVSGLYMPEAELRRRLAAGESLADICAEGDWAIYDGPAYTDEITLNGYKEAVRDRIYMTESELPAYKMEDGEYVIHEI